jgi:hypothetical protein
LRFTIVILDPRSTESSVGLNAKLSSLTVMSLGPDEVGPAA